jgi:hypothetical protein
MGMLLKPIGAELKVNFIKVGKSVDRCPNVATIRPWAVCAPPIDTFQLDRVITIGANRIMPVIVAVLPLPKPRPTASQQ